jgi:ABC-type glutathione transport system ATPase component
MATKSPTRQGADIVVDGLVRVYPAPRKLLAKPKPATRAVDDVSLAIPAGSITGIGGESGCGKSSLSRLICGLDTPHTGQVRIDGVPVESMRRQERARTVQYVFQNPFASMNPRRRVFDQVREILDVFGDEPPKARFEKVRTLLIKMGLSPELHMRFPHELSGGQLQRAAIAAAMVAEPKVLVCDEPVSALDVSVRSTVVRAMMRINAELGTTLVLGGHDLSLFRAVCDTLLVMYAGRVVESGPVKTLLDDPRHPYSQHLVASAPQIGLHRPTRGARLSVPHPDWLSHPSIHRDRPHPKQYTPHPLKELA